MAGSRERVLILTPGAEPPEARERGAVATPRLGRLHLGAGAILDLAIELFLKCFGTCVLAAGACWLPVLIWSERYLGSEDLGSILAVGLAQVVPEALALVVCSQAVGRRYLGLPPGGTVTTALQALPAVAFGLIPLLLLANVSAACCLPYFLVMWFVVLVPPVLAFETLPGRHGLLGVWSHAVPRAIQLGQGWSTLGRFLLWFLVARMVFGPMLGAVNGAWSFPEVRQEIARATGVQGDGLTVVFLGINAFLTAITSALLAAAATVHYFDLRARREGFDLERHLELLEEGTA